MQSFWIVIRYLVDIKDAKNQLLLFAALDGWKYRMGMFTCVMGSTTPAVGLLLVGSVETRDPKSHEGMKWDSECTERVCHTRP